MSIVTWNCPKQEQRRARTRQQERHLLDLCLLGACLLVTSVSLVASCKKWTCPPDNHERTFDLSGDILQRCQLRATGRSNDFGNAVTQPSHLVHHVTKAPGRGPEPIKTSNHDISQGTYSNSTKFHDPEKSNSITFQASL